MQQAQQQREDREDGYETLPPNQQQCQQVQQSKQTQQQQDSRVDFVDIPVQGPIILHKSSKALYRAVAAQWGITCKMNDHCRCLDCQVRRAHLPLFRGPYIFATFFAPPRGGATGRPP